MPILALLRDHLDAHKIATGRTGSDLVFGRSAADAFVASTVGDRADRAWGAARLDRITLHECWHTFASLLIDAGVNAKAIQTFLGHATFEMTFDQYGHLIPGSRDQARELVDGYLDAAAREARLEAASADVFASSSPVASPDERLTAPDGVRARRRKPHRKAAVRRRAPLPICGLALSNPGSGASEFAGSSQLR